MMGDERWTPVAPFYDFLSVMDQEVPGHAQQRTPKTKEKRGRGRGVGRNDSKEDKPHDEEEEMLRGRGGDDRGSDPSTAPLHSEL